MPVNIIVTNAGRAAIVNAQHNGTAPVTITQVGLSGTALVPVATATALDGEFKRVSALSGEVVSPDTIHLNMTDETNAVYTMRSFGLYLSDGTLFAIYGQPDPIINKTATSIGALTVDIIFADISAAALTFGNANFTNPPATTERQGVVELATVAEAKGGADTLRAVTPAAAKQSVVDWIGYNPLSRNGDIVAGILGFGDSAYSVFRDGAGNPFLTFDQGDHLAYDRAGNALHVSIGNVTRATFTSDGWVNAQSGFSVGNSLVWHAGNDGSGSTLDADLLDGRHASAFSLLDGSTSYVGSLKVQTANALLMRPGAGNYPTIIHRTDGAQYYMLLSNAAAGLSETWNDLRPFQINLSNGRIQSTNGQDFYGGTAVRNSLTLDGAGVWTSANDGAGSGLDADLLDGQDSSYYTNIAGRLGFTPVRQGGGIGQQSPNANIVSIGWSNDARLKCTVDSTNLGNFVFDANLSSGSLGINGASVARNGSQLFGPDNDGSGSGLDADLLDGRQGSDYSLLDGSTVYTGTIQSTAQNAMLLKGAAGSVPTLIQRTDGINYYTLISNPSAGISAAYNDLRPLSIDLSTGRLSSNNGQVFRGGTFVIGSLAVNGDSVWTAGNDGSGSGLDADLLDGQDSTYYTNIPARLGYTPVQQGTGVGQGGNIVKIGWNGSGRLKATVDSADQGNFVFDAHITDVWRAANDGSGSGLDADLLDGQQGSYYTDIAGRLGFRPVRQGTGINQTANNNIHIGWSTASRLKCTVDNVDLGNMVFDGHISDVWRASNDGAGSGLDADLLDGQDGGYYSNITARLGYTPLNRDGDTMSGYLTIRHTSPTLLLRSTSNLSAMLHCSGDRLYFLRGEIDAGTWTSVGGTWPLSFNLTNNDANLGGHVYAAGDFYARSGSKVWDAGNDGAGSGLDADLLDGQQGSYYTDIAGRLGFRPVRQGTGINQTANNNIHIGWSTASRLKCTVDSSDMGNFVFDGHISDVWRSSNDGSGSGLDADMLDGLHGSSFALLDGNSTFTGSIRSTANNALLMKGPGNVPTIIHRADASTYYMLLSGANGAISEAWNELRPFQVSLTSGRIQSTNGQDFYGGTAVRHSLTLDGAGVWTSANDGSGSGLDADLLDGQDGSYYSNVAARLGFTPIQQGGGFQQGSSKIYIGWDGSRLRATVDVTDQGALLTDGQLAGGGREVNGAQMKRGGNHLWGPDNDGSGSALDADLLDGYQADAFTRVVSQNMAAIDGYRVFADGTKECWTRIAIGQHQYATWNLPVPHDSFVHPTLGCTTAPGNSEVQDNTGITAINGTPPTSITFWNADDRTITVYVRTIGR
ncbi:hypothetical protein BRX37_16555 [Sphingomonas sp. S-NIH.Pt3_0716]|nr:hypothetical protein BRX37_16555 [Sphingomonas sp. S-NIH.Pt3_0716]